MATHERNTMNYIKINRCDVANGVGVRVVLWVAGCHHHCKGCHNAGTWDFGAGNEYTEDTHNELIDSLNNPWIRGITFSGGDPLSPEHISCIDNICRSIRNKYGESKDIWFYTGYKYGELSDAQSRIVEEYADVLVDGEYVEELRDISLKFRGSSNQRIIDVKETIKQRNIVNFHQ